MRRIALAISLVAVALAAAGCGSDDKSAGTKAAGTVSTGGSSAEVSAVREAVSAFGKSDTAPAACALMSARVRRGLLDHDPAACKSKKKLETLLGVTIEPTTLKAKKVRVVGDEAVAQVEEPVPETKGKTDTQLYYLVKESGSWRVDSVGQRRPGAAPLPLD